MPSSKTLTQTRLLRQRIGSLPPYCYWDETKSRKSKTSFPFPFSVRLITAVFFLPFMDLLSLPSLSALVLLAAALWFSSTRRRNPPGNLPPGPLNLPVIGCLHKLGSLPHISLHKLSKRYGDVMHLKLGSVSTVIISSERAAREIFKRHGLEFASRAPLICGKYFENDYSGLVFSQYTPEVKLYRKLINTHLLSPTKLKVYDGIRREEQCRLARSLSYERGNPVLLRQKLHNMNMNVITYMLFGKRFCGHHKNTANVDEFLRRMCKRSWRRLGWLEFSM
ncbi:cytochrome P450 71B22-like [Selaginella moellendorffii]|uniref:cytochrome P450 71B22-like n=1 Tax=Selaginella moellendorffii TaxID=88036 RepID=UPI000D1CEE4A|nr:cytochrome P450 71B22-like [Selaginella moellendorffii]|eukprot:XP_024543996.1 cytochrome P450 71B22-like [Selaginella moellendorffii]